MWTSCIHYGNLTMHWFKIEVVLTIYPGQITDYARYLKLAWSLVYVFGKVVIFLHQNT